MSCVGRILREEIAQLPLTIEAAGRVDVRPLADLLLRRATGNPAVFVGSGGAIAAAQLAAQLYSGTGGGVGYVQTPLAFVTEDVGTSHAGFLFTASGRHPDAAAAIRRLALDASPGAVITTNPSPSMIELCRRYGVDVINLGNPAGKDGFLATNSLIMMSIAVVRALSSDPPPQTFPALARQRLLGALDEVLVLFPPGLAAVALDLEARLSETGLAAVQIADYRNFAHGRHHGLARRAAATTVLALIDEPLRQLAERTLALLPDVVPQLRLESPLPPPWNAVDLLLASILLTADAGDAVGLDAGRPRVPAFGRRLYRLTMRPNRARATAIAAPIRSKLREIGLRTEAGDVIDEYSLAYKQWRFRMQRAAFAAVVLDYDGTTVSTAGRYELPSEAVQAELRRLLDMGVMLGFASGRGDSLQQDLRRWVPKRQWQQIHLGLYNGAVHVRLDEELPERTVADPALADAQERIAALPISQALTVADRHYQVQLTPSTGSGLSVSALAQVVGGVLRRPPKLALEVVASAHSLDILPASSTKVTLLEHLSALTGGETLAIGDQGQLGGNDFALLAAQEATLSVDRCSPDPTRCWRLVETASGPDALCRLLAALEPATNGLRFRWRGR
jgi:hypothetical protein